MRDAGTRGTVAHVLDHRTGQQAIVGPARKHRHANAN